MNRRQALTGGFSLAATTALWSLAGRAQEVWPSRPIKIIAPVAPGGGVDLVARTMGERLGEVLGQAFVIENQSGGGGLIASQAEYALRPTVTRSCWAMWAPTAPIRRSASCPMTL